MTDSLLDDTTTTPATPAEPVDPAAELTAFKRKVKELAVRAQQEMTWPDEKMNATLTRLGLAPKTTHWVWAEAHSVQKVLVQVDDADSYEEAVQLVGSDPSRVTTNTRRWVVESVTPMDPPTFAVGDPDLTAIERRSTQMCEHRHPTTRVYCERRRGHDGNHAVGNETVITESWPQD